MAYRIDSWHLLRYYKDYWHFRGEPQNKEGRELITSVTTVTSIAMMNLTSIMTVVAAVFLVLILIAKELMGASRSTFSRICSRVLNVGVIPMLIVFATTLVIRVVELIT